MSARQREVISREPLKIADWSGTLSRTSDAITGALLCSATGWKLKLTGTSGGKGIVHITAQFDGETHSDDAAPWTVEHEFIKPHEARARGYDCFWTGTITAAGTAWAGEMGDRYGGRLMLSGKTEREGVISLRAATRLSEEGRG